jgi:polysaccharide biosynthesis/export protein
MVPFTIMGRRYWSLLAVVTCLFYLASGAACVSAQQNVTVGETPQQVNDRIRTLTMGSHSSVAHDYVIGVGDLVELSVFDVPELSKDLRVSETGTINIPLVPVRLSVAGLTETQAEQKIAEVLEANGLVTHAEVGVSVKEHRSQPITVVGAVMHPMVYQADHMVTILEVLAEAGGISNDAGDMVIVTRRQQTSTFTEISNPQPIGTSAAPGSGEPPVVDTASPPPAATTDAKPAPAGTGAAFPSAEQTAQANASAPATSSATPPAAPSNTTSITINLNELLETGDTRNNIVLLSGDVVTVPHAGIVYVLGAVNRPGGFVVANDRTQLTTLKVLSLAGGLTRIAKLDKAVIIRKDENGKQTEDEIDLKKVLARQTEDITMRASDILYIPDDRTKEVLLRALEIAIGVGSSVAIFRLAYQ